MQHFRSLVLISLQKKRAASKNSCYIHSCKKLFPSPYITLLQHTNLYKSLLLKWWYWVTGQCKHPQQAAVATPHLRGTASAANHEDMQHLGLCWDRLKPHRQKVLHGDRWKRRENTFKHLRKWDLRLSSKGEREKKTSWSLLMAILHFFFLP